MSTGPLSFLGRTRKSVFQDSTQLSGATMASASETLRPVCCCSIIARPASGFRLGKDDIRSTDSGSAHRCTFSTFPYRRPLQTGRPWSRCNRRWGHESNLVLPGAGPVVGSWPASGFQPRGGPQNGHLRTLVRRVIIGLIAQLWPAVGEKTTPTPEAQAIPSETWQAHHRRLTGRPASLTAPQPPRGSFQAQKQFEASPAGVAKSKSFPTVVGTSSPKFAPPFLSAATAPGVVPRQLYLPVGVNQFCRFTSLAWPRCWAALVR